MTKADITEIRIDITMSGENALSMQLCRDGTVGRRGSGRVPAISIVILGMSDGSWFTQLIGELDERVLSHGGSYDLPDKKGNPVAYTVVFLGGDTSQRKLLCGFRFLTGSEASASGSLLPYFDAFAGSAVRLTEQWYQDNLNKQRSNGFRQHAMKDSGGVTLAEFDTATSAYIVAGRLAEEGVPCRVVGDLIGGGPTHWIWVAPEWKERAQKILSMPAVDEGELNREALSFPPPDDL